MGPIPLRLACLSAALLCLCPATSHCAAEGFHDALSFQGYTGILNTPNAAVTTEKNAYFVITNQIDSHFEARRRSLIQRQKNYLFSLGFLPWLEIGGRYSRADGPKHDTPFGPSRSQVNDLSANVKVQVPLPERSFLPKVAFGMGDVGGGMTFFGSRYAVVSEELGPLRLSLGYGRGPDRMKGAFGGVEARVFSWLYLLGEHSQDETAYGVRLVSPHLFGWPVSLQATAKASREDSTVYGAIGLEVPLGLDDRKRGSRPAPPPASPPPAPSRPVDPPPSPPAAVHGAPPTPPDPRAEAERAASALRRRLVRHGFQNVRTGIVEGTLVVEYENAVYNWNELDALGIVLFAAAEAAPRKVDLITAVIRKRNLEIMTVTAPRDALEEFRRDPAAVGELRNSIHASFGGPAPGLRLSGRAENASLLTSSVVLGPALTTSIGTEFSPFEYLVSLRPEVHTNLWKGGVAALRWDLPVAWSSEFDEGGFLEESRQPARLDRAMLFQGVRLLPSVTATLGAGMLLKDQFGTLNELAAYSPEGSHRIRLKHVDLRDRETHERRTAYIASYQYRYTPLDLSLEASAGRFFSEDKGYMLELKRFFGDTSVSFFYKNTRLSFPTRERWTAAGIQLGVPLTPRRDMKPGLLQVRGTDEFNYAQETTLPTHGRELNFLAPVPLTVNPQPSINTERTFYGRDRITPAYLRAHLWRLRDAYLTYGKPAAEER